MSKDDEKDPKDGDEHEEHAEEAMDAVTDNLIALSGSSIVTPEVVEDDEVSLIFDRIATISLQVQDGYLELGRLFFRVRKDALYLRRLNPNTSKPYETWEDYVDVESGFTARSINYQIAIWWWFSALKVFPQIKEILREIGWKKARALVGVVDDRNYEAWFDRARTLPFTELYKQTSVAMQKAGIAKRPSAATSAAFRPDPKGVGPDDEDDQKKKSAKALQSGIEITPLTGEAVNEGIGDREGAPPPEVEVLPTSEIPRGGIDAPSKEDIKVYEEQQRAWGARMTQAQIDHVEHAIETVWDVLVDAEKKADRPSKSEISRGLALEMMATHVLTFFGGAAAPTKDMRNRAFMAEMLKSFEKNYGVDLVVLDRKEGKILHGLGEEVLVSVEKKLGLDIVAFREGTNNCVYGWDKAQSLDDIVSDEKEG